MPKVAEVIDNPVAEAPGLESQALPLRRWRRITQFASLAIIGQWSFYGIFRCPFIVPYVSCQNCPVITCHGRLLTIFWGFWILIPLSALVFGRAFCGWACPGGLVNQLLGIIAPLKLRVRNGFTRLTPHLKYIGLVFALYVWLFWGQPRVAVPIRIGDFLTSVELTFRHASSIWLARTLIVLGMVALGFILANAWCRFICPAGGFLDSLRLFSLFKIYKNERCDECDQCLHICEMGTRPAESNCTNCGDCLSVCPQDAILIGRPRRAK